MRFVNGFFLLLFLATLSAIASCASSTSEFIVQWKDGHTRSKTEYEGTRIIRITQYAESGKKLQEFLYGKDPITDVRLIQWYENGQKQDEGSRSHGRIGEWRYWHLNGKLALVEHYESGHVTGPWILYRDDGTRWSEGQYADGVPTGEWKIYEADGKKFVARKAGNLASKTCGKTERQFGAEPPLGLMLTCHDLHQRMGKARFWYPNGVLSWAGSYTGSPEEMVPVGLTLDFYPNGKVRSKVNFENGLPEGDMEYFSEDGHAENH